MSHKKTTERVHTDPTQMLLALLGFKDVKVLKVVQTDGINRVHLEQLDPDSHCPGCGDQGKIHDRPNVELADVPGFHMQTQVVWKKHVYTCLNSFCERKTFTSTDPRIASSNARVTSRAVRQMTASVADGRTAKEVARSIGTSDKTVDHYVNAVSRALFDHKHRVLQSVTAIGVDEVFFTREKHRKYKQFCTSITDLHTGKVLEVLEGKQMSNLVQWFLKQPESWRNRVRHVTIDLSSLFRSVIQRVFPYACITADRFHVIKLANSVIDAIRTEIQDATRRSVGEKRKDHVLYRARKLFRTNQSSLDIKALQSLEAALRLGDPDGHLAMAHLVKEALRDCYTLEETLARRRFGEIERFLESKALPDALRRLGHTLKHWKQEILNWHRSYLTNAKAEAVNNHIKRVKRLGYGYKNFPSFRNRVLLIASDIDKNYLRSLDISTLGDLVVKPV